MAALDPQVLRRARDLYAVYQASSGGLNYQGLPCPTWEDLPEAIRVNWYTVTLRAREHEVHGTRPGDELTNPPLPRVFEHLPDPAHALELWQRYMGVAELPPSPAAILADEMRRGVARFVSAEQPPSSDASAEDAMLRRIKGPWEAYQADLAKVGAPAAASNATPVSAEPASDPVEVVGHLRAAPAPAPEASPLVAQVVEQVRACLAEPPTPGAIQLVPIATQPTDSAPTARWVPALTIGGETTLPQRQRNFALYRRLRDGDGTGDFRTSGLAGFVFDVPHERMSVGPGGASFSFRLEKTDDCFRRLLHVIADHFDARCDADDEVERLRARVAELEARHVGAP